MHLPIMASFMRVSHSGNVQALRLALDDRQRSSAAAKSQAYFVGEKSVGRRYVDSTFSTSLSAFSDLTSC
jgi:hypothetical protein